MRAPCTGQTPGEVAGGVPWSEARRSIGVTWPQSHVSRITVSGDARESERGPEPQPGPSPFQVIFRALSRGFDGRRGLGPTVRPDEPRGDGGAAERDRSRDQQRHLKAVHEGVRRPLAGRTGP